MYTKIMQNTNLAYFLYTKIVEIKILYDHECTKNVYQTPTHQYIQKMCKTVQNLYKVQTKNSLKLEMYVFCIYKKCTNYTKPSYTTS